MDLIGARDWADYKSLIGQDAFDTFGQKIIIWRKQTSNIDRYGEDNIAGSHVDIPLTCLVNYNYMRSWPITTLTESGETNQQSIQVLFSKKYLLSLGYLNADGIFDYQPDYDRFILDGLIRKPVGDSSVSQSHDEDTMFEVIMAEQRTPTGLMRT